MNQPVRKYDSGTRAFHWLTVLLLIAAFTIGFRMVGMGFSPMKVKLFNWHKWVGIGVLLLTVLRILWRLRHPPPPPVPMPAWQRRAAHAGHGLLYLLLLAQPLVGWANSSAAGIPVVWLGLVPLPDFVPQGKSLAESLEHVHGFLGVALLGVAGLHLLAALKHHFVDRDDTLRRMLPR
jgi:cytochrome b561